VPQIAQLAKVKRPIELGDRTVGEECDGKSRETVLFNLQHLRALMG
jgi:hypothetical protein